MNVLSNINYTLLLFFQIAALCNEAALSAMQENIEIDCIYDRHFENALHTVKPRIDSKLIAYYDSYHLKSDLHSL